MGVGALLLVILIIAVCCVIKYDLNHIPQCFLMDLMQIMNCCTKCMLCI